MKIMAIDNWVFEKSFKETESSSISKTTIFWNQNQVGIKIRNEISIT